MVLKDADDKVIATVQSVKEDADAVKITFL